MDDNNPRKWPTEAEAQKYARHLNWLITASGQTDFTHRYDVVMAPDATYRVVVLDQAGEFVRQVQS